MSNIYGTANSDALVGTEDKDTIVGYAGNDSLSGEGGNDRLYGNRGNDWLFGGAGNDKLSGGSGNDYLSGGEGKDTYFFGKGFGQDTISNYDYTTGAGNGDTVLLGKNIATSDVTVTRQGDDLAIQINDSDDTLRIQGYFYYNDTLTSNTVEHIQFDDGTIWRSDVIKEMVLTPTPQNDIIYGYSENDVIHGADGNDTLYGNAGNDKLHGDNGHDFLDAGEGNDTLYGGNGHDYLSAGNGKDRLYGGRGSDTLDGGAGNDTLNGGTGIDWLTGGSGKDTYQFNRGSGQDTIYNYDYQSSSATTGDTVVFGSNISTEDITVTRQWNELLIQINNSEDSLLIQGYFYDDAQTSYTVENLQFADGTVWDIDTIKGKVLIPTPQDDVIYGYSGKDALNGEEGNDTLYGNAGNDKLNGGKGNDFLDGGEGGDRLQGGAGDDSLQGNLGNDTLLGNQGNDWLQGGEGNDKLIGGAGMDYLSGDAGQDKYLFGKGAGQDTIYNYDYQTGATNGDSIVLGNTVTTSNLLLTREWDDLVLTTGEGDDSLRVQNYFYDEGQTSYTVENIQFADGSIWHYSDVLIAIPSEETPEEPPVASIATTAELTNQTDLLVSTLANFSPPSVGQISVPNDYKTNINPMIAVL